MKGGHGKVWKVRIHPEHHDLQSYRGNEENPALAIKRLLAADKKEDFKNEVNILTRLNKCNDPHLVKLLFTMEIGGSGKDTGFFLIFPLADSNLRQFWQHNFPHPAGTNTATYARWVAKQFHGLVLALCKLHNLHQIEVHSGKLKTEDDTKSKTGDPFYGIHGDIKPENLLWYKEWVGPQPLAPHPVTDPFGVLQLADFGISRLHHTETKSNTPMRGATRTYAPPELEWTTDGCSQSFDIWSLGCVFLEFICWLVHGGSSKTNPVEDFHDARYLDRTNRSLEGTIQDTFYRVVKGKDKTTFEVNPEVKKLIDTLKKGASSFIKNILEIILFEMLVVEPRKTSLKPPAGKSHEKSGASSDSKVRINCFDLAKKLEEMCKNKDDYFTKPSPRISDKFTRPPRSVTFHESAAEIIKRRSTFRSLSGAEKSQGEVVKQDQPSAIPERTKE